MEAKSGLDRIYGPIRESLRTVEKRLYDLVPDDLEPISTVEKYIFDNGGKRLRPALVLLSSRAVHSVRTGPEPVSASDSEAGPDLPSDAGKARDSHAEAFLLDHVITFAVAAELIHTATLIHDDLLDGSALRRGHKTVNSGWGNEIAVLLGDHLYLKATEILTSDSILDPDKPENFRQVYRAANIMLQTAAKIFRGEVLQHRKRGKLSITEKDYFDIIESKSASFISSCCMIGALLDGNTCPGADESLARYGLNLGIAFQIRDDILDIMGDEEKIGKAVGSDLQEGRLTLPVIHLMANARNNDRKYLKSVLGSSASEKSSRFFRWRKKPRGSGNNGFDRGQLQKMRELLLNYGSIDYSMDMASNFAETAKEALEVIPDSQARKSLMSLADHVMTREN